MDPRSRDKSPKLASYPMVSELNERGGLVDFVREKRPPKATSSLMASQHYAVISLALWPLLGAFQKLSEYCSQCNLGLDRLYQSTQSVVVIPSFFEEFSPQTQEV
jgi:hypothetical protein